MTHHRRAHLPADRPTYVTVTDEQLDALRAVARAATLIACRDDYPDVVHRHHREQTLEALPHLLDDLALADSHAERAAEEYRAPVVVDPRRILTGAPNAYRTGTPGTPPVRPPSTAPRTMPSGPASWSGVSRG